MKRETSCGAFVICDNKILLVKHQNGGHWSFPKGHVEKNETKIETAKREVYEETGILIDIVSDEEFINTYKVSDEIEKDVIYFEAIKIGGEIKKQEEEILNIEWIEFDKVIDKLTYESDKNVFEKFLRTKR